MATSHHRSSSAKRDGPADSTVKCGDATSHNSDVVASTTSWCAANASAMCQARMAGPAILAVSTSSVITATRRAARRRRESRVRLRGADYHRLDAPSVAARVRVPAMRRA